MKKRKAGADHGKKAQSKDHVAVSRNTWDEGSIANVLPNRVGLVAAAETTTIEEPIEKRRKKQTENSASDTRRPQKQKSEADQPAKQTKAKGSKDGTSKSNKRRMPNNPRGSSTPRLQKEKAANGLRDSSKIGPSKVGASSCRPRKRKRDTGNCAVSDFEAGGNGRLRRRSKMVEREVVEETPLKGRGKVLSR